MGKLLLVRHAQPEVVRDSPAATWPLSAAGRDQCAQLAAVLAGHAPAHLASSPEPKAVQTAELVAAALGIECSVRDGLEEHHRLGIPFLDDFRSQIAECFSRPAERVLGEESADECHARFSRAVGEVVATWRWPGPVAIVSHGTAMSLLLARGSGAEALVIWDGLRFPWFTVVEDIAHALVP